MTERAAHLVDYVIPEVPVRQYVLTLPFRLRFLAAFDHDLRRAVLRVFTNSVFAHYRLRARRIGLHNSRCGSVTVTQRFDSRLGLNVHFHSILLDGVYVRPDPNRRPVFHPLAPPTNGDIEHLVARIARKVQALLHDRGLTDDDAFQTCVDDLIEDDPSLTRLAAASAQGTLALGRAMGHPVPRLYTQPPDSEPLQHQDPRDGDIPTPRRHPPRCAAVDGFNLHANTAVPEHSRGRLENLCTYISRGPISHDRLGLTDDGHVIVQLKRAWRDGTAAFVYAPQEFIARLAAQVPFPHLNTITYAGVLAANAAWRDDVIPRGAPRRRAEDQPASRDERQRLRRDRRRFADLLFRTFGIDLFRCRCGGRYRELALIRDPDVASRILDSIGLRPHPLPIHSARPPPAAQQDFDWAA
jgi:hypothetical protein